MCPFLEIKEISILNKVSVSCNFHSLLPSINTFSNEKTRSEPEVAPINMLPKVAQDKAAHAEPRWRCNRYDDAKGDATELARKICGKRAENMHDKHVIKPGK